MCVHVCSCVCMCVNAMHTQIQPLTLGFMKRSTSIYTYLYMFMYMCTVHDTELSLRNSLVVPCKHPWIVVQYDPDLPQGGHRSSERADTFFRGFGLKMSETRRQTSCATILKDRERHRKDQSNYHCRNRAFFDLPSVHFTMIFFITSLRLSTG